MEPLTDGQRAEISRQVGVIPTSEWAADVSDIVDAEAARAEILRLRRIIHNVHDARPAPPLGPVLGALDDGADAPLVILALARVPFITHGTLQLVCRRLKAIISSPAFREWRVERGLAVAEHGLDGPRDCGGFGEWLPRQRMVDPTKPAADHADGRFSPLSVLCHGIGYAGESKTDSDSI